jgi:calcium-dependent protein kinase
VIDSKQAENALGNLQNFRADHKLKQATMSFISSQLISKSEKERLAKIFKAIDKNGDGKLSKEEILNGYEEHFGKVLDEDELDKLFSSVDVDGSGFIDYSEFIMATMNEKKNVSEEKLRAAFSTFDKDQNGTISPSEIKEVLGASNQITDEQIQEIIDQVDENKDGEI